MPTDLIQQLLDRLTSGFRHRLPNGSPETGLEELAKRLKESSMEVAELVKEHGLEQRLATSFDERARKALLAEAEKRKDHVWATKFAKEVAP